MRQSSLAKIGDIDAVSISIDREIASRYDDVKIVADNIDAIMLAAGSYQPLNADLTSIAGLAGTSGLLKKTATNTWALDTAAYTTNLGTVTGVTGTAPIVSSGGTAPAISISAATTSAAGSMSAVDKTKLDGIATSANNYVHPTGDGNLHVPATSTTSDGKVLMAGATAGSISWQTIPKGITDHTLLSNVGTNTHTQIDTALARLVGTSGTNTGDQTTITGNSGTATKLATARTIGGVSFDGTANINLPGVNAAGNQDTTGNASTATKLATARNITLSGDVTGTANFDGSAGVSITTTVADDSHLHTFANLTSKPTTLSGYGVTDAYTKTESDAVSSLKANLASPALTGTPTAPTATVGTSTTQLATTAFVSSEIANDTYLKNTQDWRGSMMSKAQFNALAAERRVNRAGSGFDEWGRHYTAVGGAVNDGMWTWSAQPNIILLGREDAIGTGLSKTNQPIVNVNGVTHKIYGLNEATASTQRDARIALPPSPTVLPYDATLTTEQIAMGVIKHADSSNSGLIVNGKFATDTSGWAAGTNATLSVISNKMRVTSTSSYGYGYQAVTTIIGKTYIVEFDYTHGTNTTASLQYGNGTALGTVLQSLTTTDGRFTATFVATAATTYLGFLVDGGGLYADFDNIAVFPADAISRSDLVFLETWHEDVSEKDFVYPLGNVQYLGGVTDGMGAIVRGAFSGSSTYSLFGNWQASDALVGKGYVWSGMSDAQKKAFVSNPENNCYLDGDKVIQVKYRMRVIAGMGDSWQNVSTNNTSYFTWAYDSTSRVGIKGSKVLTNDLVGNVTGTFYVTNNNIVPAPIGLAMGGSFNANQASGYSYLDTQCFALPIALVHR